MMQLCRTILVFLTAAAVWTLPARAAESASPDQVDLFEKHIRPVLAEHCYKCHSAEAQAGKKLKAKLFTDNLQGLLAGGDSGSPAVVPGEPNKSTLIKSMRHDGDDESLHMPPGKPKLPNTVIRHFEQWVAAGAAVPSDFRQPRGVDSGAVAVRPDPKQHWAFVAPTQPTPPAVRNAAWIKNEIDRFVLGKLEAKGLSPSLPAEKSALIRRVTFDLIGLPPTPEEVAAFIADQSPDAYEKLVDRLLASPHYGEKWARHWLDVSRYADTKGYVFQEERRYPYAYTYRDYVIRSLNEDKPFDRFVLEQLAADQLLPADGADKSPLAAMGFLTLGRRFLNNTHDIIDDRIDVVSRGLLGLTVACSRCHDHKFDPIPARDYYSLHGVFNSSVEPKDLPLIAGDKGSPAFEAELAKRKSAVDEYVRTKTDEILGQVRTPKGLADYLLASATAGETNGDAAADLNRLMVTRFRQFASQAAQKKEPVLAAWRMFAAVKPDEFAAKSKLVVDRIAKADGSNGTTLVNPLVRNAFAGEAPKSLREVADRYGKLLADHDKPAPFADANAEAIRQVLRGPDSPLAVSGDEATRLFNRAVRDKYNQLRSAVQALQATSPDAPPRAMVLTDSPTPGDSNVFIRGNPGNQGIRAPRQFLSVLASPQSKPFSQGSGRLELARAIASRDNPLTARVFVNRVWGWHFGKPLVSTPSDFGVRTERPVQAELLDHLAVSFMNEGWSIKKLHRGIVLSATYRQSSEDNAAARAVDPDNTLLWRQNRKRLEFEGIRDAVLAVAGQLNTSVYGRPVDIGRAEESRRTIYGFVDRQNLPSMFRSFDFASPDTHAPGRFSTTVPQQALFFLNSPFVHLHTKKLLERPDLRSQADLPARVNRLHQVLFGRNATSDDIDLARLFIESEQASPATAAAVAGIAWSYGYGTVDEKSQRVTKLTPLPYKGKSSLRAAQNLPDPKLGFLSLSANGGHPDKANAVIRRMTVSAAGTLSVEGVLNHPAANGDGVRGLIVSSKSGIIGQWKVRNDKTQTNVEKIDVSAGDTIDFVTESGGTSTSDSFTWTIKGSLRPKTGEPIRFDSQADFDDSLSPAPVPQVIKLGPWEKYVQVLLASNEFVFVE
jgi:hypothetical protein